VSRFQDSQHSNKEEPQKPVETKPQPTSNQPISRFDTKKRLSKVPQRVENYVPSLDAEEFASMSEMGKSTSDMKTTTSEPPKNKPPAVPKQKPSQRASNLFGKMDNQMVNDNKELTESEKEEMKKQIKK